MTSTARCVGCLGTLQCWICSGEGCHRCEASGACHLCRGPQFRQRALSRLVPRQSSRCDDVVPHRP